MEDTIASHSPAASSRMSPKVARQLWILSLFPLSEHIAWSSSFPYMYAMVESFEKSSGTQSEDSTAFNASLLLSFFTFGEFLMAPQWARTSDIIGRKPTLLIGSLGTMGSSAAFGLSRSLIFACIARFLAGALNPNLGVLKTYVGELVSKEDQAKGFSTIYFMAGLGFIIGPVIGGYLAQPTKLLPSIFPRGSLWDTFPFLLPNLLVVVSLAVSCTLGLLYLQEVHPHFRAQQDFLCRLWTYCKSRISHKESSSAPGTNPSVMDTDTEANDEASALIGQQRESKGVSYQKAFSRQIMLQIVAMVLMSFEGIAIASLVPTFLSSPQPKSADNHRGLGGGFGLSTSNVSNVLLTQAVASVLCQIFVVPQLIRKFGTLRSFRLALFVTVASYPLMPLTLLAPNYYGVLSLMFILWIQALFGAIAYTTSTMMITNNCSSPDYLATINGVAASLGCLAKTAGPAVVAVLYDQGIKKGNVVLPFFTLSGTGALTIVLSWWLHEEHAEDKTITDDESGQE